MTLPEIELFTSRGCPRCARMRGLVDAYLEYRKLPLRVSMVDVVAELDRAVALGVRATPALVIDGRLVLTGAAAPARLHALLDDELRRMRGGAA